MDWPISGSEARFLVTRGDPAFEVEVESVGLTLEGMGGTGGGVERDLFLFRITLGLVRDLGLRFGDGGSFGTLGLGMRDLSLRRSDCTPSILS